MKLLTRVVLALLFTATSGPAVMADDTEIQIDLNGSSISISGPDGELSTTQLTDEEIIFSNHESSAIYSGEIDSVSAQLLIEIDDESSPSQYSFSMPNVAAMEVLGDSKFEIYRLVDSTGLTLAWLSSPWAHDANGESVPTYYKFENGILSQVVEHNRKSVKYPVTADPYLGIALISSVKVTYISKTSHYLVSVGVSNWVWSQYIAMGVSAVFGYSYAYSVVSTYGWPEVVDKVGLKYGSVLKSYVSNHTTFRNQFDCHAMGAPVLYVGYITGYDPRPTWDLESERSAESNPIVWAMTRCSWK